MKFIFDFEVFHVLYGHFFFHRYKELLLFVECGTPKTKTSIEFREQWGKMIRPALSGGKCASAAPWLEVPVLFCGPIDELVICLSGVFS